MLVSDADPRIGHNNPELLAAAAATHQHTPDIGVSDGIAHQVGENALEQHAVADNGKLGGNNAQFQSLLAGTVRELDIEARQHRRYLEGACRRFDLAGIELPMLRSEPRRSSMMAADTSIA